MVVRKRLTLEGPSMTFVTTTVKDWIPVFESEECAQIILTTFVDTLAQYQIALAAYVLMPSHLHALLGFKRIEQMSEALQSFKSISSRRIKPSLSTELYNRFNECGKFQFGKPRFDDLIIWLETQFRVKMDYIHNNPGKNGLTEKSTDYLYSSARDWLSAESGILPIEKNWKWLS